MPGDDLSGTDHGGRDFGRSTGWKDVYKRQYRHCSMVKVSPTWAFRLTLPLPEAAVPVCVIVTVSARLLFSSAIKVVIILVMLEG